MDRMVSTRPMHTLKNCINETCDSRISLDLSISTVCPSANAELVSLRWRDPLLNMPAISKAEMLVSLEFSSSHPILSIRRSMEAGFGR
jgi:hypothetical protein